MCVLFIPQFLLHRACCKVVFPLYPPYECLQLSPIIDTHTYTHAHTHIPVRTPKAVDLAWILIQMDTVKGHFGVNQKNMDPESDDIRETLFILLEVIMTC